MSFWSENNVEPKRNYRFLVSFNTTTQNFDKGVVWFAKNVTVPSFNVTSVTHDFLDNKYYYPGRVEWQTISLTLVDPVSPDAVQFVNEILEDTGYLVKNSLQATIGNAKTISKAKATKDAGLADMEINIINEDGEALETWKLQNPFIESAKFGDLDYTNDDLRTVELTVKYDWATCDIRGRGDTFFKAGANTTTNNTSN